jgi:hypothetical protein
VRPDLDAWAREIDAAVEAGVDPFLAVTQTDPRNTVQGSVQLALERRG